jgi:hypothetical protein
MANSADSPQRNHGGLLFADSELLTHVHGVVSPSLVENWSVLSDSIDRVGFEHRFWDPGAPEDSQFIGFADCNPTHYPELSIDEFQQKFWDPRSSDELMSMQFMRRSTDFIPAQYHELHIV